MEDRKEKGYPVYAEDELGMLNVASSSECTGLEPTPPESDNEAESYASLYNKPQMAGKADDERVAQKQHPQKNTPVL